MSTHSYHMPMNRPNRALVTRLLTHKMIQHIPLSLLTIILGIPVFYVTYQFFSPNTEVWQHLVDTVLWEYIRTTLLLGLLVGIGVTLVGVSTAGLIGLCDFPGKRLLEWLLLLPLAFPAYIIGYTYSGIFEFFGPLHNLFLIMGVSWTPPEIRSLVGAASMIILVLYPYVYLLAKTAFKEQSSCVLEVSRSLGCSPFSAFFRVAMPLARPAIMTGVALVLMETFAQYGIMEYFGVPTFTIGIFRTWFGLGDPQAATQLSAILLIFICLFLLLEQLSRRRAKYFSQQIHMSGKARFQLKGVYAYLAILLCALPVLLGFIIPSIQLLVWSITTADTSLNTHFLKLIANSLTLATMAALLTVICAFVLAYAHQHIKSAYIKFCVRLSSLGYAVPGTVIALGILLPITSTENIINNWLTSTFNLSSGLFFSGGLLILIYAYVIRFIAIAMQSIEAGFIAIKPSLVEACRSLGYSTPKTIRYLHIPILRRSLLTASLFVFVEVLKELPATLILRPFDFNTLSVRAFEMASDERLADAGLPSLTIVAISVVPVLLLGLTTKNKNTGILD